jgi:hypothetical protein
MRATRKISLSVLFPRKSRVFDLFSGTDKCLWAAGFRDFGQFLAFVFDFDQNDDDARLKTFKDV